ncbi:uncharacterized protein DSM5745_04949 [Aspergillus mulundensis]|uniref:Uncharacterized protein n=1 Tax=Aspergillus mulundensis TaxID=1810919 RepID=A0A3D8S517_9EURO|nr:hypothetical protein DSM5745_04949 [Aspergillus mulundensis]RDW81392.1 hypothetical protein DSM5745_04949 [Aspergillus mulundensis]
MPPRRTWSQAEDDKLASLVTRFGDKRGRESRWHEISKHLPGRTNKDCRKRWFHSLDPSLRKGRWTPEEDALLLDAYQRLGPAWKEIAALIAGRKDDQCSKRYNDILNPSVRNRLEDWSAGEDRYLTDKVAELGNKWSVIAAGLPGRPPLTCRNRWRKLARASARAGNEASLQPQSDSHEPEPLSSTDTPTSSSAPVPNSTKQRDGLYTSSPPTGRLAGRIFDGIASLNPVPALGHLGSLGDPDGTLTTPPECADSFPVSQNRNQHTTSAFHHRHTDETLVPTRGHESAADAFLQAYLHDQVGWEEPNPIDLNPVPNSNTFPELNLGLDLDLDLTLDRELEPENHPHRQSESSPAYETPIATAPTESVEEAAIRQAMASFGAQQPSFGRDTGVQQHHIHHIHIHHHHHHHHHHK